MVQEGARVRLRPGSTVVAGHPELAEAIGVVGSIVRSASLANPTRGATMHVRFAALNIVAMNVPAADVEPVDHLSPELRIL